MSDKACPDCEVHTDCFRQLTEITTEKNHMNKDICNNKKNIGKIFDMLDKKVNNGTFVVLLTTLVTIFLFIFGFQISVFQKVNELSSNIKTISCSCGIDKDYNRTDHYNPK